MSNNPSNCAGDSPHLRRTDAEAPKRDSFIRWQHLAVQQLGGVNNLLIGLATGAIAFECRYALDPVQKLISYEILLLSASLFFLTCSVGLGLCTAWNRLVDCRKTARIARLRGKYPQSRRLDKLRKEVKRLGKRTWHLLRCESICFATGLLLLLIAFFVRFSNSHEYQVEGQIFRLDSDGRTQKAAGAAVHVFHMPEGANFEPNAEVHRLKRELEKNKSDDLSKSCGAVAHALQRQYAETMQGIDPRLISDSTGLSLLEEWQHIRARQDFASLSESKKRLVKQAFWLRRFNEGGVSAFEFNEEQADTLWKTVFEAEISAGLVSGKRIDDPFEKSFEGFNKEYESDARLLQGIVAENADPDGRFSLTVKRGKYLLIGVGELPELRSYALGKDYWLRPVVWVKTITVPRQGSIVMAEPFCNP
jgi:hypothetical protein